jgi:Fe-Mn family superoxide dismutase
MDICIIIICGWIAVISAETMEIHHSKHHNTYVTNLNASLEKLDAAVSAGDVSGIIGMQGALKFNGGGHLNHTLFWENLCPASESKLTDGPLMSLMGDVDALKAKMSASTIAVQGSGWGWLGYNKSTGTSCFSCHNIIYATCVCECGA